MSTDPLKQAEQAALAQVNKDKATAAGWLSANKTWLIVVAAVALLSFIAGKLV